MAPIDVTPTALIPADVIRGALIPAALTPTVRVLRTTDAHRPPPAFESLDGLDALDAAAVARALRHIRSARALRSSPLCGLRAVARIAQRDAVASRPDAAQALADLLRTIVANALSAHRGTPVAQGAAPRGDLADGLYLDFTCGDADREAWSVLFHRFTSPTRFPAKAIERTCACSRRTVLRRADRGFVLLDGQLRAVERTARNQDASDAVDGRATARGRDANSPPIDAADLSIIWQQTVAAIVPGDQAERSASRAPQHSTLRALAVSLLLDGLESTLSDAWHDPVEPPPMASRHRE